MDLSQQAFADRLARSGGARDLSKSLISQWERGGVKNPNNENLLAVQAVTGFAMEWLINGKGPQKAGKPLPATALLDVDRLARAMAAALPASTNTAQTARVVAALYELLADTPDLTPTLLARFAKTLTTA